MKRFSFKLICTAFFLLSLGVFAHAQTGGKQPADANPSTSSSYLKITKWAPLALDEESNPNHINGTVRFRVTFLKTGKIGDVTFVSANPSVNQVTKNGLLRASAKAAKKIKFEPATKDGEPITVTKVVEFAFR